MTGPDDMLHERREWLRVVLSSIGDAVITTDVAGNVTFLNPVAEKLTGWQMPEAIGVPLATVFRIVNESTGETVENPAQRALREGVVVGLANHTLLIAKDGSERPIDDSASPIRDPQGLVAGVVLVFRDVSERRREDLKLRESEERFRLLVERVRDYAIFMLDPHGVVTTWNAGAEHIKGYKAAEVIGQHFSKFYPAAALERRFPEMELEVAAAEGRFEDEGWRLRKDGSLFWANVVITALYDEQGQLRGFAKVTRDLTERRKAEEAIRTREERHRRLADSANDAIVTVDADGVVTSWNRAAALMFGYDEADMLGKPLVQLLPERHHSLHRREWAKIIAGDPEKVLQRHLEIKGLRKDRREFPVELSLANWSTEEGQFYTAIIRDISERKQKEKAEREREVLSDLNRRKDEFLAMLSHELRNPLAPITTAVELLSRADADEELRAEVLPILSRQVEHLKLLVGELLDVSRITTGQIELQLERTLLQHVVQRAADGARSLIVQRQQELELELGRGPLWVEIDAARIEQVLINLLTNAAKYTDPGGRIRVVVEQDAAQAVVRIIDSGVGIAPELLPRVFDLFTQADRSLDRSQGGLGIGLSVVRRVVEMHDGQVSAQSAGPGKGSEFVVRLALSDAPASSSEHGVQSKNTAPNASRRILIVDDNRDAANSLGMLLRVKGHEVHVVYNGVDAVNEAQRLSPEFILLDIGLPEIDGYEIARQLRERKALQDVQIVAVTGYGRETDRQEALAAGFDAHLVKPVDANALFDLLAARTD